jgi:hypothetical protein
MVNEDRHPASVHNQTLLPQERIHGKAGTLGGSREARFLKAGNLNMVLVKEVIYLS